VTGFAKMGFPHTSTLTTLVVIHNFRLVNTTDLQFGEQEAPTKMDNWKKFQLHVV